MTAAEFVQAFERYLDAKIALALDKDSASYLEVIDAREGLVNALKAAPTDGVL